MTDQPGTSSSSGGSGGSGGSASGSNETHNRGNVFAVRIKQTKRI
jgi:hypothetical protein